MRKLNNILVTGGAEFIGCNFIHVLLQKTRRSFSGRVVNLDAYAGNAASLADIRSAAMLLFRTRRHHRPRQGQYSKYDIDTVIHFAAESHVDRSILGPEAFIKTNVMGTFTLLDAARASWKASDGSMRTDVLFHHISTDEVYGSLGDTGYFTENTPYDPRSPYSASKASSDHLVFAYHHTYGMPVTLSNCRTTTAPTTFPRSSFPS